MFMILVLGRANHCRRRGDFQKRCGVVNSVANELDAATGKDGPYYIFLDEGYAH